MIPFSRLEAGRGTPTTCGVPPVVGVPLPDMGTSEHAYGLIMKALFARAMTGKGSRVDISMFESTTSWLTVPITMTCSFGKKISRRGNTHEFFAPVSVYPTSDGYVYIAVGNDKQFQAFSSLPQFSSLAQDSYRKNAGRIADVDNINKSISEVTAKMTTNEFIGLMKTIGVAASKINTVKDVAQDPLVSSKLIKAKDEKSGFELTLAPPPGPAPFLEANQQSLSFPPRFGEHNEAIYGSELGIKSDELATFKAEGVI